MLYRLRSKINFLVAVTANNVEYLRENNKLGSLPRFCDLEGVWAKEAGLQLLSEQKQDFVEISRLLLVS